MTRTRAAKNNRLIRKFIRLIKRLIVSVCLKSVSSSETLANLKRKLKAYLFNISF